MALTICPAISLIRKSASSVTQAWVILNLVREYLRMMAPKPGAARAGGVKEFGYGTVYYVIT
jgi:hypothetical protein